MWHTSLVVPRHGIFRDHGLNWCPCIARWTPSTGPPGKPLPSFFNYNTWKSFKIRLITVCQAAAAPCVSSEADASGVEEGALDFFIPPSLPKHSACPGWSPSLGASSPAPQQKPVLPAHCPVRGPGCLLHVMASACEPDSPHSVPTEPAPKTKTRAGSAGGGRKPWQQKAGRARHAASAPQSGYEVSRSAHA